MTFTARPLHLNEIFANMTYESLEVGDDEIIVSIHDGEGGECLSLTEHMQRFRNNQYMGKPTIHRGCTSVVRSLSVRVFQDESHVIKESKKLPLQLVIALVFAAVVIIILTVVLPLYRWRVSGKALQQPLGSEGGKKEKRTRMKRSNPWKLADKKRKKRTNDKHRRKQMACKPQTSKLLRKGVSEKDDLADHRIVEFDLEMSERKNYANDDVSDDNDSIVTDDEWTKYFDKSEGAYFFENRRTRKLTWTPPY